MQTLIKSIDIVTASGTKQFAIGPEIDRIEFVSISVGSDQSIRHYVGYKQEHEMFRVSALCPVVVEKEIVAELTGFAGTFT